MTDSVKKILRDKLRKFLLPDFTNQLTWLFGITGVSLIAVPTLIKVVGKVSYELYGVPIEIEFLSEDRTLEGIALCVFALIQNIAYQAYQTIQITKKNSQEVEHIQKEKEILTRENEYLEAVSAVNVVAQIKALKELHENEVTTLKAEAQALSKGNSGDSEEIGRLEAEVRSKEVEISSLRITLDMMAKQSAATIGHEFVFGGIPFEYNGRKYLAGVINDIHMHFPLEQVLQALKDVSSNPNAPVSKHLEQGKYILTLNNEGSFKMTLTDSELDDLRSNISRVKAA